MTQTFDKLPPNVTLDLERGIYSVEYTEKAARALYAILDDWQLPTIDYRKGYVLHFKSCLELIYRSFKTGLVLIYQKVD